MLLNILCNCYLNLNCNFTALHDNIPTNVCQPSPCGPNSICRNNNGQAACSCSPDYIGIPPGCHPECVISSECSSDKACVNKKCVNPCKDACGINTDCRVVNHSPICYCRIQYSGDPFTRCTPILRKFDINSVILNI